MAGSGWNIRDKNLVARVDYQIQMETNEVRKESEVVMKQQIESRLEASGELNDLVFKLADKYVHCE